MNNKFLFNFHLIAIFFISSIFCFFIIFNTTKVNAFGLSPSKINRNVLPGEIIEETITLTGIEPALFEGSTLEFVDYEVNEEGGKLFFEVEEYTPDGMAEWIQGDKKVTVKTTSGNEQEYKYKVQISEDASPGTHKMAILLSQQPKLGEGGVMVGVSARVAIFVNYTVAGEIESNLELVDFRLNENKLSEGIVEFDIELKNTGNIGLIPTGKIELFRGDELLERISEKTEKREGEEIIVGFLNHIKVNPKNSTILQQTTKTYKEVVDNLLIEPGNYTAKLELVYENPFDVEDKKILKSETSLNIEKGIEVEQFDVPYFHTSLPINFTATVVNNGKQSIDIDGDLTVYDLFGGISHQIPISKFSLSKSERKKLDSLSWATGSAFGFYTGTLRLNVVDTSIIVTESKSILVLTWWQIVLVIVLLLIFILATYKLIRGYLNMKHKLEGAGKAGK